MPRRPRRRWVIASPYPEASVIALSDYVASRELVGGVWTTLSISASNGGLDRMTSHLATRLSGSSRYGWSGVDGIHISTFCALRMAGALGTRRLHLPPRWNLEAMQFAKRSFDREAAKRLQRVVMDVDVVAGMWGCSAATLKVARAGGATGVLNYVNSPGRFRNERLRSLGDERVVPELLPKAIIEEVEEEAAVADVIVVASQQVREALIAEGVEPARIVVEAYGVARPCVQAAEEPWLKGRLLFVGQVSYRKGLNLLIEAVRGLRGVQLDIVGPLVRPEILRNLPSNVAYSGARPSRDVSMMMRRSALLVLPSVEDAFGLVVTESMAQGTPALVSPWVGARDVIEPNVTGFVLDQLSATSLREAIASIVCGGDERLNAARAGLRAKFTLRSWEAFAESVASHLPARG